MNPKDNGEGYSNSQASCLTPKGFAPNLTKEQEEETKHRPSSSLREDQVRQKQAEVAKGEAYHPAILCHSRLAFLLVQLALWRC